MIRLLVLLYFTTKLGLAQSGSENFMDSHTTRSWESVLGVEHTFSSEQLCKLRLRVRVGVRILSKPYHVVVRKRSRSYQNNFAHVRGCVQNQKYLLMTICSLFTRLHKKYLRIVTYYTRKTKTFNFKQLNHLQLRLQVVLS